MDKENISELFEKYAPRYLSANGLIYSHNKMVGDIKKIREKNQKLDELFLKYKQQVETQR